MSMIDEAFASLRANAAKPLKGGRQTDSKTKSSRKAGKGKSARQKANQSDRKASGSSRNFKLSPEALKELRAESGKGFISPYRPSSTYHACIAAIQKLGAGKFHSFEKIIPAIIEALGDAAANFKAKKNRSDETGKDWKERIVQNVKVLARPDYGAKLRQVGYEVRTDSGKGAGLFKVTAK